MNTNHRLPKLVLHGLDQRFLKTMMLFLRGPCNGAAIVVNSVEDADIDVFDVDAFASKNLLSEHLAGRLQRPVIVLSLHEFAQERVYALKKPIKKEHLMQVLAETANFVAEKPVFFPQEQLKVSAVDGDAPDFVDLFNNELHEFMITSSWKDDEIVPENETRPDYSHYAVDDDEPDEVGVIEADEPTVVHSSVPDIIISDTGLNAAVEDVEDETSELKTYHLNQEQNKTAKHQTAMRLDEKSYADNIGFAEQLTNDQPLAADHSYDPKDYFQGFFNAAWTVGRNQNHPLLLKTPWCPISIFPRSHEVWLDAGDAELSSFAGMKLKHKNLTANVSLTPIDPKTINVNNAPEKFQNIEAFRWKLACWSSQGRYPYNLDITQPVYLNSWPNFTRLLITPHAIRIAALLIQGPRTMPDLADTLGIKQQYVFVFISATYALGLSGQAKRLSDTLIEPPKLEANKAKGLLSRIINRLIK